MGGAKVKKGIAFLLLAVAFVLFWYAEEGQFLQPAEQSATAPSDSKGDSTADKNRAAPAPLLAPGDGNTPAALPQAALSPETEQEAKVPAPKEAPESTGGEGAVAEAPPASLDTPAPLSEEAPAEAKETEDVIKGTVNKGDTVTKLLEPHTDATNVQEIVTATRRVFPLTSFRAGQPYVLICDVQSGAVKRFEYEIDRKRKLVVEGQEGTSTPVARVEEIEYDTELALVEARIDDNLFQSVADIGESPQLALLIANLFGWEINFIRDLQEGDSFSVLFEKLYRDGQFKGYGRTLGATFTNKGKTYEAFLFHDSKGREHHYNVRGENLRKVLLQAPLSFTRVTSGYTKSRKHPIFGDHRAHFGVDYGAPTGTPVKAVGDGTVTLRGWVGGYGNQVIVKHGAGLESMYSHLSGFARGIAKGTRVRQGQVIAFVGSTGNSTGPHLDFRLKQQGQFVNPTKAVNPRSEPVGKNLATAYQRRMDTVRQFMKGERPVSSYNAELLAPPPASALSAVKEEAKQATPTTEKGKEVKPAKKTTKPRKKTTTRARKSDASDA